MVFDTWNKTDSRDSARVTTGQLIHQIKGDPLEFQKKHLDSMQELHFEEYLNELMKKHQITAGQLIIRTCLSKPFVYQVLKGERVPGRDVILRISLALGADMDETQHLLMRAGKGILYPKVKRDAAILCCIETGKSLADTNLFLEEHGEKGLL